MVGGGVSGLAAALFLARRGVPVELREAAPEPGGLLAPIRFGGADRDRGAHRVHPDADPALFELAPRSRFAQRLRRGRLLLGGRELRYPPRLSDLVRALGPGAAIGLALGLARGRLARWEHDRTGEGEDEGFESFLRARTGASAYERFYAPYAEKVWGEAGTALSRAAAKLRFMSSRPARFLLARDPGRGSFLYPRGGMSALVHELAREAEACGVTVRTGHPFAPDDLDDAFARYAAVLYSAHLSDLVPEAGLQHRGLYLVHLAFPPGACPGGADTYYAPEPSFCFGRVSRPERFTAAREDADVLCVEVPEGRLGPGRDFAGDPGPLVAQLVRAGIVRSGAPLLEARQTFLPRVYPIYRRGFRAVVERAIGGAAARGPLFPFGRQGLFLHCNVEHCARVARDLADHLLAGGTAAAWGAGAGRYLGVRVRD